MNYQEFLQSKMKTHETSGIPYYIENMNANMYPFQKEVCRRSLAFGKYAIFADCGLGKTIIQLEWARIVSEHTKKPVLILCPLSVAGQTINEGKKFGIECSRLFSAEYKLNHSGIYITNYEQLDNICADNFGGIVLDESSILKNFEGKTKKKIIELFYDTPYKLCCTATPAPNDPEEIGNHSEFLNIMSRTEMLAKYFVHDGGETAKWRLKGHAQKLFYQWVGSWAVMLNKPSDIGFDDDGYKLPKLNYTIDEIKTNKRDNGLLFNDTSISATQFNSELRLTMQDRLTLAAKIANETNEQCIVWIKLNQEGDHIKKLIPDAVEVRGDDTPEVKEERLLGFGAGKYRVLISKPRICQFGLNFQRCHRQIFASLDFSFESLYQAVRRSYRFGQKKPVDIHIITVDTMGNVLESITRKENEFKTMKENMIESIKHCEDKEVLECQDIKTDLYTAIIGDSCIKIKDIPDESIGLSVFSPPFADLYTCSDNVADMGNSKNYDEFEKQFSFLIPELYRIMMSGRVVAVHCMDLPVQKAKHGHIGLRDFSGIIINMFESAGFIYHSRITIWKNPVTEMQRTKALGLLHKQVKKDCTMSRVGIPDYVLLFRKKGENNIPVANTWMSVDTWQEWASPVWMDIDYGDTLNYMSGRDEKDEKHICPLQLPTIERIIALYSNEGETVFTPFMGIGSEVYQAVKMNRIGYGIELKESYFNLAIKNIQMAADGKSQMELFA